MIVQLIGGRYDGAETIVDDNLAPTGEIVVEDGDICACQKYKYVGAKKAYYINHGRIISIGQRSERYAKWLLRWIKLVDMIYYTLF